MNRMRGVWVGIGLMIIVGALIVWAVMGGKNAHAEQPTAAIWWSKGQAGVVGGIGGSVVGLLGACIGVLGGARKARSFVLGLLLVMGMSGVFALCAGLAAVALRQPYHVFYPLLLLGCILTPLSFALRPTLRAQYDATELQRMRARDAH